MEKCLSGCRMSCAFIQLLLLLPVFICSSVVWSDGLDRELYRSVRASPDWFSRAGPSVDDDDDVIASFGSMLKRRRAPFRSDLGKRFLLPSRYAEEEKQPLVFRGDYDLLWPEPEEKRWKRYRYFKADLGKRANVFGAHRRQPDGFRPDDFERQSVGDDFEGSVDKRRMFRSDLG